MMLEQAQLFLNESHEEKYYTLLSHADVEDDIERETLFYIISGNSELYSYVNTIYDFKQSQLKISNRLGKLGVMCDGSKAMLKLAIQLYNATNNNQNIYDTFVFLDDKNKKIAIEAIKMRFRIR